MPGLNVPKSERAGLTLLYDMPEESFKALLTALERSPSDSTPDIPGMSPYQLKRVIDSIKSMYEVRTYNDVPLDRFVKDICESLAEHSDIKTADDPKLSDRLTRLMSIDTLNIAAKAALLRHEYPYTFCSARILSDARPVFGPDPSDPPVAMVIAHTLKLEYHGAAGHLNELYMALDSDDISQLREVLDRAEAKSQSLRNALAGLDLEVFDG